MKNKKGFTLIELLAVIVIIAIIALITAPVVLSSISTAKTNANKESARAFVKASEFYCASQLMATPSVTVSAIVLSGATGQQKNVADVGAKGTQPTALTGFSFNSSCIVDGAATLTVGGTAFTVSNLSNQ